MENAGAVRTDGTLWTMGQNTQGQLGQIDTTRRSSPVQVGSDTTWSSVDGKLQVGRSCYFCVKTDGTLWAWGTNNYDGGGQLGQNNTTPSASPVQIGTETMWTSDQLGGSSKGAFAIMENTSV